MRRSPARACREGNNDHLDMISAATIAAEIGDMSRFPTVGAAVKEPFGTNRLSAEHGINTLEQLHRPTADGHRAHRSVLVLQSNRVPKPQFLGSTEEISLNSLGGIRVFLERCARIESISDEMRELVEKRWPDLVRKLPPKR